MQHQEYVSEYWLTAGDLTNVKKSKTGTAVKGPLHRRQRWRQRDLSERTYVQAADSPYILSLNKYWRGKKWHTKYEERRRRGGRWQRITVLAKRESLQNGRRWADCFKCEMCQGLFPSYLYHTYTHNVHQWKDIEMKRIVYPLREKVTSPKSCLIHSKLTLSNQQNPEPLYKLLLSTLAVNNCPTFHILHNDNHT